TAGGAGQVPQVAVNFTNGFRLAHRCLRVKKSHAGLDRLLQIMDDQACLAVLPEQAYPLLQATRHSRDCITNGCLAHVAAAAPQIGCNVGCSYGQYDGSRSKAVKPALLVD